MLDSEGNPSYYRPASSRSDPNPCHSRRFEPIRTRFACSTHNGPAAYYNHETVTLADSAIDVNHIDSLPPPPTTNRILVSSSSDNQTFSRPQTNPVELDWTNQRLASQLDMTVSLLWVLTPVISTASLAIVLVAMTTNQWLLTQENMVNPKYNGSGGAEFLPKSTVSGLWQMCHTEPGEKQMTCNNIDYFSRDDYVPDPNDSTMAIPYTVSRSAGFFLIATLVLLSGEICCLFGHVSRQRRLLTFISGLSFIVSGLFMLIGLVMYISVLKAEIGGKLRPRSLLQPPLFTFRYGFSFFLYVAGFIITEIAGTCAVFLYIYWHQREWMHKRLNLHQKLSGSLYAERGLGPLCRRHPQLYISSTTMRLTPPLPARFSPIIQRRLYLDKENGDESDHSSPCHGQHVKVDSGAPLEREICSHGSNVFPRDVTTNTMSTSADAEEADFSPGTAISPFCASDMSNLRHFGKNDVDVQCDLANSCAAHEHDFVPFDLDHVIEPQCRPGCPLRRTTPV